MSDENSKIAVSTHFIMFGLNIFCAVTVWHFFSEGLFKTKGMTLTGEPAQMSLILFTLSVFVFNFVYAIGLFRQLRHRN